MKKMNLLAITILFLTLIASYSTFAKNTDLIARKDLSLSLEKSEKNLSDLFNSIKCALKRIGEKDILIQRGDKLQITKIKLDRVYFGTRTFMTGKYGGGTVPQKVYDMFAGVYTFSLKLDDNKEAEMTCLGEKTKISYISSDSSINYSGLPIVQATNDIKELSFEEVQSAIENYFELQ